MFQTGPVDSPQHRLFEIGAAGSFLVYPGKSSKFSKSSKSSKSSARCGSPTQPFNTFHVSLLDSHFHPFPESNMKHAVIGIDVC